MKVSQFLLFLVAITGANFNQVFKKHVFVNTAMNFSLARDYCKENYVDMSIIDTEEEYNRFTIQTAANPGVQSFICLRKNASELHFTQWCDGTVLKFTKYGLLDDPKQNCITTSNNVWNDDSCYLPKTFFCYSEVIVVEEMKTWDEASEHCKTHYTDLFSVTTSVDLLLVSNMKLNITTSSFWTGLRFLDGFWIWVHKKVLGKQVYMPPCPNQPLLCGSINVVTNIWENRDCNEKMYFICLRQRRV